MGDETNTRTDPQHGITQGDRKGAGMRRKAWMAVAAVLVVTLVALGIAACGGGGGGGASASPTATASASATATGGPVIGGTLNVAYQGEPTGLDPAIAYENESWDILRLTYQGLLTYASDPGVAGTEFAPCLATEVPSKENGGISADGTVFTFHLRQGVMFPAPVNREVTAEDFKWSFERMLKEPRCPVPYFYTGVVGAQDFVDGKAKEVTGYEAVDKYTVRITLGAPDVTFLSVMTMTFTSVVPKEWVEQVGKQIGRKPLGTGPFIIESWTAGQNIVAKKNPTYWDTGKPYLDGIKFDFTASTSTALLRLERGDVDVLGDGIASADYQRVKNDATWGKYVIDAPQISSYFVSMNVLEKPYDNVKVRQAVNYAVDTAKIQKLMAGTVTALNQVYPNGMPGYQPSKVFYTYDPAKARQLLSEAGFPNGFKTTLYGHNVDPFPKLAQAIQADLKAVGIQADIKLMDRSTYWTALTLKKSHISIGLNDWNMDFPDPSDWVGPLYTNPQDGGMNASFWEDAQVNTLFKQSFSELDPTKRLAMFDTMQNIIMEQAPSVMLYQPVWNGMCGKNVGGYYIHPVWINVYEQYWKTQ
jgi:ABC-type transport system substrate-binding protein